MYFCSHYKVLSASRHYEEPENINLNNIFTSVDNSDEKSVEMVGFFEH